MKFGSMVDNGGRKISMSLTQMLLVDFQKNYIYLIQIQNIPIKLVMCIRSEPLRSIINNPCFKCQKSKYLKFTPWTQEVNWTYIRSLGRLLNVLCMSNLPPVSRRCSLLSVRSSLWNATLHKRFLTFSRRCVPYDFPPTDQTRCFQKIESRL